MSDQLRWRQTLQYYRMTIQSFEKCNAKNRAMSFLYQVSDISYQAHQGAQFIPSRGRLKPVRANSAIMFERNRHQTLFKAFTSELPDKTRTEMVWETRDPDIQGSKPEVLRDPGDVGGVSARPL